jgi:hypothetical protein
VAAGDPYWNNVVLAMHMDGTNASTVFTDLKGHAMTAVGNAQISTAQSKFGGASALFDGAGDYITTPTSTDFDFGVGDFTIECFYRATVLPTAGTSHVIVNKYNSAGNQRSWMMCLDNTGGVYSFRWIKTSDGTNSTGTTTSATFAPSTGVWYHLSASRQNGVLRLAVDGTVITSYTEMSSAIFAGTAAVAVGASSDGTAQYVNGYLDDIRITKGIARYTTTFTPPTLAFPNAPAQISGTVKDTTGALGPRAVRAYRKSDGALSGATTSHSTTGGFSVPALDASPHYAIVHDTDADPYWPNVVLATHFDTDSVIDPYMSSVVLGLHMEGANAATVFTDVTGKTLTAAGTAVTSADTARFGNTSGKFGTSTANKVTAAASTDFALGGGSFTIELWVYMTAYNASGGRILSAGGGVGSFNSTTGIHWLLSSNATGIDFQFWAGSIASGLGASAVSLNVWTHIALSYDGTTVRQFINGVLSISLPQTVAAPSTTPSLAIGELVGATAGATNAFSGYLDDIRITKGVCRYTSTFTAPTAPFSSFKDLTGKDLMVAGVPSINTTTKKYGSGSLAVNGVLGGVQIASSSSFDWAGDFTVEAWVYSTTLVGTAMICMRQEPGSGMAFQLNRNSATYGAALRATGGTGLVIPTGGVATINSWDYVAITRKDTVVTLWVNGAAVAYTNTSNNLTANGRPLVVGYYDDGGSVPSNFFSGYIDDLRITKGVARYTSDFTPPERAFPGAVGTSTANALIYDDLTPI